MKSDCHSGLKIEKRIKSLGHRGILRTYCVLSRLDVRWNSTLRYISETAPGYQVADGCIPRASHRHLRARARARAGQQASRQASKQACTPVTVSTGPSENWQFACKFRATSRRRLRDPLSHRGDSSDFTERRRSSPWTTRLRRREWIPPCARKRSRDAYLDNLHFCSRHLRDCGARTSQTLT